MCVEGEGAGYRLGIAHQNGELLSMAHPQSGRYHAQEFYRIPTIYQQGFLRVGIRRLQITPTPYSGEWGDVSARSSATLDRLLPVPYDRQWRNYSCLRNRGCLHVGSGIFANTIGASQKQFAWSITGSFGPAGSKRGTIVREASWSEMMVRPTARH